MPGIPAPKGSRITGRRKNGSLYTRPASNNEKAWTAAVALVAAAKGEPLEPPYEVAVVFCMPRPKKPSHDHPTRGDLDKFVRSTLDGLTEGDVIVDDRHVIGITASKRWAEPGEEGALVTVVEV